MNEDSRRTRYHPKGSDIDECKGEVLAMAEILCPMLIADVFKEVISLRLSDEERKGIGTLLALSEVISSPSVAYMLNYEMLKVTIQALRNIRTREVRMWVLKRMIELAEKDDSSSTEGER